MIALAPTQIHDLETTQIMKQFYLFMLVLASAVAGAQELPVSSWTAQETLWDPQQDAGSGRQPKGPNGVTLPLVSSPTPVAEAVTPEIEALARGLENDPLRIFNYVHDHIRHVLYFGSKKGAQLTLLERSGNDFDQCALLVALLRAAGYSPAYQFGFRKMPYDSPDHKDIHHWLELSIPGTDWYLRSSYLAPLLGPRGFPDYKADSASGTFSFHRLWVKLAVGGTNYYLDPAFKVSEPVAGVNLSQAMGLDTNVLNTAAGGVSTADYVQNLDESAVRNKLCLYTTNLLAWMQSNSPNASVQEVVGGWKIQPSTDQALSRSQPFENDATGGYATAEWTYLPTNLMARLALSFEGTNYQWLFPTLQGKRVSLTFDSNAIARLWLEDTLLVEKTTSGPGPATSVTTDVDQPFGYLSKDLSTLTTSTTCDDTKFGSYQRTNSSYAILYAFDPSPEWLRSRQDRLAEYRQATNDTSREVTCETLNTMGLSWMEQTGQMTKLLSSMSSVSWQAHHQVGRMAQESGLGYYVDVSCVRSTPIPSTGITDTDLRRKDRMFELLCYFGSALENGIIEQLQSSNLVAASTIKMLQLANSNSQKVYLTTAANWETGANVKSKLANYNLNEFSGYITQGYSILLPEDGMQHVAGANTWKGYGALRRFFTNGYLDIFMSISGNYGGGYSAWPYVNVNADYVSLSARNQPTFFDPAAGSTPTPRSSDPVRLTDGAFELSATDLSVGQAEPRGFSFTRSYNSARRRHSLAGMAHGWTHNYYFNLSELSAPDAGLGGTTPAQMAPMLAALRTALDFYNATNTSAKNWLVTALVAKWGVDQIINNAVSVTLGDSTVQFVRQPDGSFTPPANCTMTLEKTGAAYTLSQRHGNRFEFGSDQRLSRIVDPYGKILSLSYRTDTATNLVSQATDWKDRTLTFTYSNTPSRLVSITDGTRTVSYGYGTGYNAEGDLCTVTDPETKTSTIVCDANHQIIRLIDARGQTTVSNLYDGFGRVIEQYTQGDTAKTWRFYWSGFVNTEEDPTGARRRFLFDEKCRPIGLVDALGNVARSVYDGQDHVVTTVSPMNEVRMFQFDGRHNLVRSVDPLGYTNTFRYNSENLLTNRSNPLGANEYFGYNSKFQMTGATNGAGDWIVSSYDPGDGALATRTDASGSEEYHYDSQGYLDWIINAGNLGTNGFLNNAYGDVLVQTNARGFTTTLEYNKRRQLLKTISPTNVVVERTYDSVGNVDRSTDARGSMTRFNSSATGKLLVTIFPQIGANKPATTNFYDKRDLLERTVGPLLAKVTYSNDVAGRLRAVGDPVLRTNWFEYDADGRTRATVNAASETSLQVWDARGALVQSVDGAQHTVGRGYDAAGNQVRLTNRNEKVWQFGFDGAGRMTNTTTPLNHKTHVAYDKAGRVRMICEPSGDRATNYYDARGKLTNRADSVGMVLQSYDANNNRTAVIEGTRSNTWTFDAYDRVSCYTDADGLGLQYRFDGNGNMTQIVYPGNRPVTYVYDSLNRLTSVDDWAQHHTTFEYDLASRLRKITRPNGTRREITYDDANQTRDIWEKTSAGVVIARFKLNWNTAARMDWEFTAPPPQAFTPPTRTMTNDDDNRITVFNGASVRYDGDGNMTNGPGMTDTLVDYTYDARNRLLAMGGQTNGFDPMGNRTSITNGAGVTRFVVNPNAALSQVLMRIRPGVTNYYIYGKGLLYEITETATTTNALTYHFDYRGSTAAITDGTGAVTERFEYSVYGGLTYRSGSTDTPFLYNGRYGVQTDANGLLHMRARFYNPHLCRFINPDPAGFAGGLNWYAYADGNPVSSMDPFGLCASGPTGAKGWMQQNVVWPAEEFADGVYNATAVPILTGPSGSPQTTGNPLLRMGLYLPSEYKAITDRILTDLNEPTQGILFSMGGAARQPGPSSPRAQTPTELFKQYPMNDGFAGNPVRVTLPAGYVVSRYGSPAGYYASPAGTPSEARSLPPSGAPRSPGDYRLTQDVEVDAGLVAPYYGQPGFGIQFRFKDPIQEVSEPHH